ncbi:UvrD-helicase domain-containing protein [Pantoea ananatis]|uniref:UvrD-helicase domain-containing protein n=1 Tax=Pantoea ananas TaxID=553 RepID=UPI001B317759|nr:ATP-dependent helicase [Pantoea ananatis]
MPYKNLTSEQWDAVKYEGNLLLTACPGSGKTKTLVSKLCYLLDEREVSGGGKRKIIALTYTNIAAETIYERLMSFGVDTKNLWIGTIHSFCLNWIVKPNVDRISRLSKGFNVIDEHEKGFIINELKEKYGLGFFDKVITSLTHDFRYQYSKNNIEFNLVKDYHSYLYSNRLIDFDLILNLTLKLLNNNASLCQRLSLLFSHILIDEYQDTSLLQYEILRAIYTEKNNTITLIGDKEQAIYTGLGAVVKDIKELSDYFGIVNLTGMNLTGCFRSSQSIVDFYSKYKDSKLKINSLSKLKDFKSVIYKESSIDKSQLANYVHEIINIHLKQGISPSEIAVLCPSWFDVINLSSEILLLSDDLKIDGVTISPIPKNSENIWLNLVKLLLIKRVPSNFIMRQKILNELVSDLSIQSLNTIIYSSKSILTKVNQLALNSQYDVTVEVWLKKIIVDFCSFLHLDLTKGTFLYNEMDLLINATTKRIKKYSMVNKASDLSLFFNSRAGVKITTCHSTKGDEYEVVICTGLLNGKIPHWNDIFNQSREHSDYVARRILYVVSSRAKKHLYLISEQGHKTKRGYPYDVTPQL